MDRLGSTVGHHCRPIDWGSLNVLSSPFWEIDLENNTR
jgi:hypothetical protein